MTSYMPATKIAHPTPTNSRDVLTCVYFLDVALPPWAKSPRDFLKKNSKALESDICTSMLPKWIDLIFGSKSRGDAAKDASNLFHRYAYFRPSDLSSMPTQEERFQAESHASEFGIVPDQLFIGPHPLRHETVDESFVSPDIGRTFSGTDDGGKADAWELLEPPSSSSHDKPLLNAFDQSLPKQPDESMISEISDNFLNPAASLTASDDYHPFNATSNQLLGSQQQQQRNNRNILSSSRDRVALPLSGTGDGNAAGSGAFSSWGQEPTLSNVSSFGGPDPPTKSSEISPTSPTTAPTTSTEWDIKFIEKNQIHEDAISGCSFIPPNGPDDQSTLVTTSLDGGLKVHKVTFLGVESDDFKNKSQGITSTLSRFSYIAMTRGSATPSNETKLKEYRSHTSRDPLACLALASDGQGGRVAFAGGHDDVVLAYGINSGCAVASVYSHRDAVTGLDLLVRPLLASETALWLEKSTHVMVSGSWDATVKVWSVDVNNGETVSINREPLAELFDAESSVVCVSAACTDGGGVVIGAGCADGSFCVWNVHSDGVKVVIHKEPARRGSGPCSVVKWSFEAGRLTLFTGFATGKVASFTLIDGSMRKASAASVGVAVRYVIPLQCFCCCFN